MALYSFFLLGSLHSWFWNCLVKFQSNQLDQHACDSLQSPLTMIDTMTLKEELLLKSQVHRFDNRARGQHRDALSTRQLCMPLQVIQAPPHMLGNEFLLFVKVVLLNGWCPIA